MKKSNIRRVTLLIVFYAVALIFLLKYLSHEDYCSYANTVKEKEIVYQDQEFLPSEVGKEAKIVSLGPVDGDVKNIYSVTGWGITQKSGEWYPGVCAIVLYSNQAAYEVKTFSMALNDVPMPSEISQEYDSFKAGFFANFPGNSIRPDRYEVGVLFDDGTIIWTSEFLEIR